MERQKKIELLASKGVQVPETITDAELDALLIEHGENNPPAPEVSEPPVPTVNPPPAANLVVNGNVRSEREIQLEREREELLRRQRELETVVSEKERDIQELKKIPTPAPEKPKRKIFETFWD
jgi:hypothetical protein